MIPHPPQNKKEIPDKHLSVCGIPILISEKEDFRARSFIMIKERYRTKESVLQYDKKILNVRAPSKHIKHERFFLKVAMCKSMAKLGEFNTLLLVIEHICRKSVNIDMNSTTSQLDPACL